ncbi:MAG: SPFH domain-containing protein [Armatimonadetes bacterium]|nr:SPFH domain-containing protein [Armatimonadota bacterium]
MTLLIAQANSSSNLVGVLVAVILVLVVIFSFAFTVGQQTVVVIQRLGKFNRLANAGLNFKIPFIESRAGFMNLRIKELDIPGQFKTKDNVFVDMMIRVQYSVIPSKVADAFYRLAAPEQQIAAFVLNVVRTEVARMELKDVFEHQDTIGNAVNSQLSLRMSEFGFEIQNSLVNEVQPAAGVVQAMNAVMASENTKIAARNEGEAHKMRMVLQAEADAESKRLQGEGIAKQREAIVQGLAVSVDSLRKAIPTADSNDLMRLVLMNQYFDALRDIAHGDKTKVVFMPSSPNAIANISEQLFDSMVKSQETSNVQIPQVAAPPKIDDFQP